MKTIKHAIVMIGFIGVFLSSLNLFSQEQRDWKTVKPSSIPAEKKEAAINSPILAEKANNREQKMNALPVAEKSIGKAEKEADEATKDDKVEEGDEDDGEEEEAEKIINSLILVDESVYQVLDLLEQLTEKTILRQQDLPKIKINLNSNGPITKTDAILAVESLLSMNGVAVVDMGEPFLKAVPAAGVQTQSPKLLTGSIQKSRPSQKIYSKIFKLHYLSTKEGLAAIAAMGTKGISSQVALEKSNAIFVVDTLMNLQRIETLFEDMDKPLALQEELVFYPIQYVNATDLKVQFDAMKKGNLKKYLESTTIEADKVSNQLIVLTHANNKPLIDRVIAGLDIESQALNKSQVFRLKHAETKELTGLLKALIKGIPMPQKEGDSRAQLLEKLRETVAKPGAGPAAEKGQQFSETLTLEPDERSNAVVVYGTPRDLELVGGLINELDVLLAQVRIEVIIAEVTLTDDQVCGLQSFGIAANLLDPSKSFGTIAADNIGTSANPAPNLNFHDIFTPGTGAPGNLISSVTPSFMAATISKDAFNAVFRVVEQSNNVRILSAPMIVTTHNRKAIIKVVRNQPYAGASVTDVDTQSNLRTAIEYYNDIGIVLEVTPRIGPNGIIQMEIHQNVRTILETVNVGNNQVAPAVSNREAESFISVQDQEVIVLAGLQQRLSTTTKAKLWILGYLPVIGDLLFSPKTDSEQTVELIMFIRPHVMNNMKEVAEVTCDALNNNITSNEEINHYIDYGHFIGNDENPECDERTKKRKNPCDNIDSKNAEDSKTSTESVEYVTVWDSCECR